MLLSLVYHRGEVNNLVSVSCYLLYYANRALILHNVTDAIFGSQEPSASRDMGFMIILVLSLKWTGCLYAEIHET